MTPRITNPPQTIIPPVPSLHTLRVLAPLAHLLVCCAISFQVICCLGQRWCEIGFDHGLRRVVDWRSSFPAGD